jgi:hypothetical protein
MPLSCRITPSVYRTGLVQGIPEDGKRAARTTAEGRYRQFVEHVAEQFSGGRRFLDDLPHEEIADNAELGVVASAADSPLAGS